MFSCCCSTVSGTWRVPSGRRSGGLGDAADDTARAACEGLAVSASTPGAVGPCEGLATVVVYVGLAVGPCEGLATDVGLTTAMVAVCCSFAFLARFFLSFLVFVFVRTLGSIPPSDGTYTGEIDSCVDVVAFGNCFVSLSMILVISAMRSSLQNPAFPALADFCVDIVVGTVAGQHVHVGGEPCEGFCRGVRAGRAAGCAAGGGG